MAKKPLRLCVRETFLKKRMIREILEMQQAYYLNNVKYITDRNGRRKEVIIPVKLWSKLTEELEALKEKQQILLGLEQACQEIKLQQEGNLPEQTLEEFILRLS